MISHLQSHGCSGFKAAWYLQICDRVPILTKRSASEMYGVSKEHAVHNYEVLKSDPLDWNNRLIYTTLSLVTSLDSTGSTLRNTMGILYSFAAQDTKKVPSLIKKKKISDDKYSLKFTAATDSIFVSRIMLIITKRQKMWKGNPSGLYRFLKFLWHTDN
jgi:hypothetical protein